MKLIKYYKEYLFIPECEPLQFWILSRHGTRYTDVNGVDNMWSLTVLRDQIITNNGTGRK